MTKGEKVIAVSNTIREHILANYPVDPDKRSSLFMADSRWSAFRSDLVKRIELTSCDTVASRWTIACRCLFSRKIDRMEGAGGLHRQPGSDQGSPVCRPMHWRYGENQSFTKKLQDKIGHTAWKIRYRLVGHCSDMPAAMLLADLVVSASSSQPEAFGKVAIEAMAMGRPVLATSHGGSLETVIDGVTGWLVAPSDPAAMAEALRNGLADRAELRRRGAEGRTWVNQHFTTALMCTKTIEFISAVDCREGGEENKRETDGGADAARTGRGRSRAGNPGGRQVSGRPRASLACGLRRRQAGCPTGT